MKLLTRSEKKNKKLLKLYEKYVTEGRRPQKAAKMAREKIKDESV